MNIAIVKPDHFGDLVLSSAAIQAVLVHYPNTVIYVAPANLPLARFLFGAHIDIRTIVFSHLSKRGSRENSDGIDLLPYDLVLFLRHDGVLTPKWADLRCRLAR